MSLSLSCSAEHCMRHLTISLQLKSSIELSLLLHDSNLLLLREKTGLGPPDRMYQSANHNSCLLEVIIHIRGCLVIFDQVELILPFHWPTSCVSELYVFKSCEFSIAILVWFQTELLEYDAHYTQLNFLKTFSNFANQNITYACRNSMAWEDGRYSIKLKGSNEMEYHATSKTSLRPKVLSNGCMVSENHRYLFPPSSRPPTPLGTIEHSLHQNWKCGGLVVIALNFRSKGLGSTSGRVIVFTGEGLLLLKCPVNC